MINLKDKLKKLVNAFRKEPIAIGKGFKRLEKVKRVASETGKTVQAEKERYARPE